MILIEIDFYFIDYWDLDSIIQISLDGNLIGEL